MFINIIVPNIAKLGGVRIALEYTKRLNSRGHKVRLYQPLLPYIYDEKFSTMIFLKSCYSRLGHLFRQKNVLEGLGFKDTLR
jgi:hypothetical protein